MLTLYTTLTNVGTGVINRQAIFEKPSVFTVEQIADALDTSVDSLLS